MAKTSARQKNVHLNWSSIVPDVTRDVHTLPVVEVGMDLYTSRSRGGGDSNRDGNR